MDKGRDKTTMDDKDNSPLLNCVWREDVVLGIPYGEHVV